MLTNLALAATVAFAGPSASASAVSPVVVSPLLGAPTLGAPTLGVGGKAEKDASDAVSFTTEDKQLIKGSFYAPKKSRKGQAAPSVLLLHDAGKTREELSDLAAYLHKRGFAVLTMDMRGHGESQTDKVNFEKADGKLKESLWALSSRDVDAAAEFLSDQKNVHSSNLSIVAFGAGSSLAVRRASVDDNVRAVVLVNPAPNAFGYNLVNGVSELGGLPTLLMSPKDHREESRRLQEAAHKDNNGLEYVDITPLKSEADSIQDDKRLKSGMGSWLREQAMPKK